VPIYIRQEEARAILGWMRRNPRYARWYLLFRLCWESGARISEALALRTEHIGRDWAYVITLKQRKPHLRQVFCSAELCTLLREAAGQKELAFASPDGRLPSRSSAWRAFKRAAAACGVLKPKGEHLSPAWPHTMRHGRAMAILDAAGDRGVAVIRAQFGHVAPGSTLQYLRPSPDEVRQKVLRSLEAEGGGPNA